MRPDFKWPSFNNDCGLASQIKKKISNFQNLLCFTKSKLRRYHQTCQLVKLNFRLSRSRGYCEHYYDKWSRIYTSGRKIHKQWQISGWFRRLDGRGFAGGPPQTLPTHCTDFIVISVLHTSIIVNILIKVRRDFCFQAFWLKNESGLLVTNKNMSYSIDL